MNKLPINPRSLASLYQHSKAGTVPAHSASVTPHQVQATIYQGRQFGPSSSPKPNRPSLNRKQGSAWLSKKTNTNSKPKTRSQKNPIPTDTNDEGYEDPDETSAEIATSNLGGKNSSEFGQQEHQQSWGGNEESSDKTEENMKQLAVAKSNLKKRASGYNAQFLSTAPMPRSSLNRSFADQLAKRPADADAAFIAKLYIPAVITACNQVACPQSEPNTATSSKGATTLRANIHMLTSDACQAMPSRNEAGPPKTLADVRTWLIEAQKNTPPSTPTSLSKTVHLLMAPLLLNLKKTSKPDTARLKNLTLAAVRY